MSTEDRKVDDEDWLMNYEADYLNSTATIEIDSDYYDVDFDLLTRISDRFGTKRINVTNETRSSGGCETCNFEWGVTVIEVLNVARWP